MTAAQNTNAILAMCAIVIVTYAIRNSEAHYLPDLLGLALALAAPRQSMAIVAWLIIAVIRHSALARTLAAGVPVWLLPFLLPYAHMSISDSESSALESAYQERVSVPTVNMERAEEPQPVAKIEPENFFSARAEIMASAVLYGAISLTEATRLAAGAKGGRKYQQWSRLIKMEMDRKRNHYPAESNLKRFD